MTSLGDLVIKIGGDVDGFRASMQEASAAADQFTNKLTASLSQGVTLFDAYGRAIDTSVTQAVQKATVQLTTFQRAALDVAKAERDAAVGAEEITSSTKKLGAESERTGFSFRYAFFAVKDLMEGRTKFFIAELANEAVRMGGAFLSAGIAVAALAGAGLGVAKIVEFLNHSNEGAIKIREAFNALNDELRIQNDELQVSNDKLDNEIAKIEKKPENGIKLALDEAILAADQLGSALNKDLGELEKVASKNGVGGGMLFGKSPTDDIEEEIKQFRRKVDETTRSSNIPRAEQIGGRNILADDLLNNLKQKAQLETNTKLTALYSDEIRKLNRELQGSRDQEILPGFKGVDPRERIEMITGAIRNLQEEQRSIGLKTEQADKQGDLATAKAKADAQRAGVESARKAAQDLKTADEDALAEEKSHHEMSVGETIQFWQQRLAAEAGNVKREHEINVTLGNLYQEREKMISRVAEHGAKLMEEQAKKAEEWAAKMEGLAVDAQKLIDTSQRQVEERQTRLTKIGIQSEAQGQEGSAGFRKLDAEKEFASLVFQTESARIALLQREAAIEQQISEAKIEALSKEQQDEEDPVKKAELGLQLQRSIIEAGKQREQTEIRITEEKRRQSLADQLADSAMRIPGALGNSLAHGIMSGKNIGQDIAQSLRGIGQQMMGTVFNRLISTMLQNIAVHIGLTAATSANTAATSAHTAVTFSHMGVMAAHMGAVVLNTIATVANTLWTAILAAVETVKSFFGFADGGSPPVGVPSIVGERGPELFIPKQAGVIIPNHQLNFRPSGQAASMSSSQTVNIGGNTFHFHGIQNVRDMMRQIASIAKTASPQFSPAASR